MSFRYNLGGPIRVTCDYLRLMIFFINLNVLLVNSLISTD